MNISSIHIGDIIRIDKEKACEHLLSITVYNHAYNAIDKDDVLEYLVYVSSHAIKYPGNLHSITQEELIISDYLKDGSDLIICDYNKIYNDDLIVVGYRNENLEYYDDYWKLEVISKTNQIHYVLLDTNMNSDYIDIVGHTEFTLTCPELSNPVKYSDLRIPQHLE